MRTYTTDNLPPLDPILQQLIYNGLDGMMTQAVAAAIPTNPTYEFEKSLLPMVVQMMQRGILIDTAKRDLMVEEMRGQLASLTSNFDAICAEVFGRTFNPRSYVQLQELLYRRLHLPEIIVSKKGEKKISTDRDTLERLQREYTRAMPITIPLLQMRDLEKVVDTLTKTLSPEGRWHANFNIGGTDTGRWSSSSHPYGWGSNLQNIDDYIRRIFIPDPGRIFFNCDQQGAEARVVGYLAGDEAYIKAVESGDVHTMVAAMVFGFEPKRDLADRKYYREMSYRDIAKRAAHGCLTADHDVLTPQGWRPIDMILPSDQVACWDTDGTISFGRVQATTSFVYEGTLHHFEGAAYDLLATHDHRMPYTTDSIFKVASAETLPRSARLPIISLPQRQDVFHGVRTLANASTMTITKIPTKGTQVYCLTVPTSYFLVRRNNKIMVTGNSNYGGTPRTIAQVLKVEIRLIEEFQARYFKAFPNLRKWHAWVLQQIQTKHYIVTPFGRRRNFWGNPHDDATLRAAIAYVPQSTVGDLTSRGLFEIYKTMPEVEILNNIHDAAFGQIPETQVDYLLPKIVECLTYPLDVTDIFGVRRRMTIPWESQVGRNWGKRKKDNPDGLA